MRKLLISLLLAAACLPAMSAVAADGASCSLTPMPRQKDYPWMSIARWHQFFDEDVAVADKGGVDLLFVGDSITEMWNQAVFDRAFGGWRTANFGVGGDHTGNLLWRLQNGHAEKLRPKAVVLTIGVNNFNFCDATPEQAYQGVKAVVELLRKIYPDARILLNAVLPYGQTTQSPQRLKVVELNRMVANLNDGQHVFYQDYGLFFLQPNGDMSADVMPDFLHPSPRGYQIWADAMLPAIRKLME